MQTLFLRRHTRGFTIVELLIVIVVIAVLAAITIVAYNGIANQAKESAVKSDLETGAKQLHLTKVEEGAFPSSFSSTTREFNYTHTTDTFCLSALTDGEGSKSFRVTEAGSVEEGDCDAIATTMQAFTPAQCSALTTYTGSNESAIIELTDSRADQKSYQIAKLADGNCWMLENLKLGSATSTITLTSADSDVATNFTLPQLTTSGATDYDTPGAYGPVPGDTGSGSANYGYFYNFSAATAGESRTSLPTTGGDAQHSICPAGWKLPTGGSATGASDFSKLDQAFGGTGVYQADTPHLATGWHSTGAFKGNFSGAWSGSFFFQGSIGYFWSRSAYPSNADLAFGAGIASTDVSPGTNSNSRGYGLGVRCLLN